MKKLFTILVLLTIGICFSSSFAGGKTIIDGVLQIPKAGVAPEIDGLIDDVWLNVTALACLRVENAVKPIPDSLSQRAYDDFNVTVRTMWDDDNFYVFINVIDDTLFAGNTTSPWMNDNVEIYFDGGNEKATGYDANDLQIHWNYGETPESHPITAGSIGTWVWSETMSGYNFELMLPHDILAKDGVPLFDYVTDKEIGYEISVGDEESLTSPQYNLHWWTCNNLTWQQPNTFGTAILSSKAVNPTLELPHTSGEVVIDGEMIAGEGWELADEITNTKVEGAAGTVDDYPQTGRNGLWKDFMVSCWTMWNADNFYVFIQVADDTLFAGNTTSPWMNDNIELFFDGGNEKATGYDANDLQVHWNYGETPESHPITAGSLGEWVWLDTELGYNFELALPHDVLAKDGVPLFDYVVDKEIGYEISVGDEETLASLPQKNFHWWTTNNLTWQQPNTFGTAILVTGDAINDPDNPLVASSYKLDQNYPNPFNPTTEISYTLPTTEKVKIVVYNLLGDQVAQLVNATKIAGTHKVTFNAQNLSSGVYFYQLEAGNISLVKKMMFIK